MDDYKEDLKRIAHMISDSEDKSFDETKALELELEKLTEIQKFRKNATTVKGTQKMQKKSSKYTRTKTR